MRFNTIVSTRAACRLLLGAALLAPLLPGHDLQVSVRLAAPAAIVRAAYGGSESVSFAQVAVYKPGAETEFQTGRTDANGVFSFVPDSPGAWRVAVDDELGHRGEAAVEIPSPFEAGAGTAPAETSILQKALLGLALMLGITGFLYGYTARRGHK